METLKFSFPFLILIITLFHVLVKRRILKKSKLPPGPWKLPIIGSLHHLIGGVPFRRMRELSNVYGPIMLLKLGERTAIVISTPDIAEEVLKTKGEFFVHRPSFVGADTICYGSTNVAFSKYGQYWKQLRKICTLELLSAKRVRSFRFIREDEVSNLMRHVSSNIGYPVNITDSLLSMTYNITARAAFGEKCEDQDEYIFFMKESMRLAEAFTVSNFFPSHKWLHMISGILGKWEEIHRTSDLVLQKIISSVENNDGDGSLLSVLLNGASEFQLSMDNIKAVIQDMFIGGSETSSTTLEWAFSELLKNPKVLKRAQAEVRDVFGSKGHVEEMALQELKFLKAVIKETLRLHPPGALLLPRQCEVTCEVSGYMIPAGTQVFVNAWAIGRDPKYWTEPDRFNPERFLDSPIDYKGSHFEFIPFGAGKRICPGIIFATANIELPLAYLLYKFNWALPPGISHENLDMTEVFGTTTTRKGDLFAIPSVP